MVGPLVYDLAQQHIAELRAERDQDRLAALAGTTGTTAPVDRLHRLARLASLPRLPVAPRTTARA